MAQLSPGRFLALWTSAAVGVALAAHVVRLSWKWPLDGVGQLDFRFYLRVYSIPFLATTLLGCLQARILAVHRRRVPWWAPATVLGWAGGAVLGGFASTQVVIWLASSQSETLAVGVLVLVLAVTAALAQGVAQALALWGRRWGSETLQWLAGLTLAHLLAAAVGPLLWRRTDSHLTDTLFLKCASVLLSSAVAAGGTAWLLDRIVFRGTEQHV